MSELILSSPIQTLGDLVYPVRSSHHHQTIQVSCLDGRILETQLGVGLVFFTILKDINYGSLTDIVIILPDHTVQEIGHSFSQIYNQALRDENQEENVAVEYCNVLDEDVKEELIEEKKAETCLKTIKTYTERSTDTRYNCDY